ncbi:MAG: type II toxin-antitoxin system prevent-host-death family antitoxin [Chloroflexia bacterium]|nr:type II toxin-antitoxin system prevent-host-death family antitoxin [Chloroflexia bacterium]
MTEQERTTQTMKISEVKARLSSLVNEVYRKETRVLVEKAGIPVAALVTVKDLARLTQLEHEKSARWKALETISLAFEDVPLEELEAQLDRIAAEGPQLDDIEPTRKLA